MGGSGIIAFLKEEDKNTLKIARRVFWKNRNVGILEY
jgi:hypothetical protein